MQTPLLGATALAPVAAVNLLSARAEGPKPSGGNLWSGISQPVGHDAVPAHSANPWFLGPRPQGTSQKGFLDLPFDPEAAAIKPHYEWQYHYAGRHPHRMGHWVLVMAPIQSAAPAHTVNNQPLQRCR
jgi:hypothetical protein